MAISVKVKVPATTANCGPGFDTIGIACTAYNELELVLNEEFSDTTIEISGEGYGNIPTDGRNIVLQAVNAVLTKVGKSYPSISLKMKNDIPLASGLGSSAAAIVAGLVAANHATGNKLSMQDIFDMATAIEGHPDNVAPALFGGVTISAIEKEQAHCLRFIPPAPLSMIVAVPKFGLSTKISRKVLPESVLLQDAVFNISRTALLIGALSSGEFSHLRTALQDKLHQPYRQRLIPGMQDVFKAAIKAGAYGSVISGAGPCLIAFADQSTEVIGQAMVNAFAAHNVNSYYIVLSIDVEGAKIIS